ncbi:uncharacterized protein MAM_03667 [Metarhizium album ARSEF 1941]|uniref:Transcription factor, fungi n=1 Tax=Metarhizium album (strain ARSEF 1941) TaxID=1081103 RepID=A0A0B2WWV6_METAS|nr:uncharacterized protein MAM_03667 [Metarhizium album ARSEF 1941]KHN98543.1 Transcription factor, fungi [Metarhizium album ARSEF 1941]
MTPTPPSTNSSAGKASPEEKFRVREGMDTTSCSYASPASRKKSLNQADSSPDDMQNRIDRLEGLVLSLMHNGANIDPKAPRTSVSLSHSVADSGSSAQIAEAAMAEDDEIDVDDHLAKSIGILKVDADRGKSMYIGQEHWHLILADIAEVKNYFTNHKKEIESSYEKVRSSKPATAREGPTLLLGASPASEVELRGELPFKSSVLTLCSRYFNSMENAVSIIHGPTFFQQLRDHWQDPSKTPIMWLGLLYSILCLAMLSYHKVGDEPPEWRGKTLELAAEYRLRTVQCLIKADYTKPVEHTVETMLLYVFGEYSSRWDVDHGLWMIVSLIIRIAFRMGYHRDAKWFPSLSPFQAEMRRRTWALVRMADVVFSHQVSLPSMIYDHDCDTQLPNNIFDDEINTSTQQLPPSRPISENTPVSYMIAKARLCIELGSILQATNRVDKGVPYDEIIRFDAKLRQIMQELPPHLKIGPMAGSRDPVTLIIARFNIDILFQKIMCLLHRKYIRRARQNPRYAHSRKSAIEASLQAMEHLQTLHRESKDKGRLRTLNWYVKSIATKEFILPAMLIVLDLHYDNLAEQSGLPEDTEGAFRWSAEQRARMISTLEDATIIWKSLADGSMEAFKASKTVDIMLRKLQNPIRNGPSNARSDPISADTIRSGLDPSFASSGTVTISPEGLNDFGTGMSPLFNLNSGAYTGMEFGLPAPSLGELTGDGMNLIGAQPPLSMLTNIGASSGSGPELSNFEWGAFESYAQAANWGADQSFQIFGGESDDQEANMTNSQ